MSNNQSNKSEIREKFMESVWIDGMVAPASPLFRSTRIPVRRWFLARLTAVFDKLIWVNPAVTQSRVVAALRDALLPKRFFGKLRAPDTERIVGRSV